MEEGKEGEGEGEDEEEGEDAFVWRHVYRARRPFHPQRLWNYLTSQGNEIERYVPALPPSLPSSLPTLSASPPPSLPVYLPLFPPSNRYVLRSKGFFWLATRGKEIGVWSQVGASFAPRGGGRWWCETAEEDWPEDEEGKEDVRMDFWEEEEEGREGGRVGDRRQEVALIGVKMGGREGGREDVKTRVIAALDACLVTEEEWREGGGEGGMGAVGGMRDPFPEW